MNASFNESGEAALHRLSTADVAPAQALDYYASAMQEALIPMQVQCRSRESFHAAAEVARFGEGEVLRMVGSAHRVSRGPVELARSERRLYNLMVNRLAPWRLVQRGRCALNAGDAILLDSALPHELEVGTYELVNVAMSAEFVERWLHDPSVLTSRPLGRNSRWSAPLAHFVAQLTPEFLNGGCPLPDDLMLDQIGGLLMLVAANLDPVDRKLSPALMALQASILGRMRERFADAGLRALDVGEALGIGERSVHEILAAHGQTFAAVLLHMRLAEAGRLAARPDGVDLAAIARQTGFRTRRSLLTAMHRQARSD